MSSFILQDRHAVSLAAPDQQRGAEWSACLKIGPQTGERDIRASTRGQSQLRTQPPNPLTIDAAERSGSGSEEFSTPNVLGFQVSQKHLVNLGRGFLCFGNCLESPVRKEFTLVRLNQQHPLFASTHPVKLRQLSKVNGLEIQVIVERFHITITFSVFSTLGKVLPAFMAWSNNR